MTIHVYGIPAPQGSKRHVGGGRMVESSKKVKPWRESVKWAAVDAFGHLPRPIVSGPVRLTITFILPRPKRPKCSLPDRTPDLSKLIRSTEDALTEVAAWEDDARVVEVFARKVYVELPDRTPGAVIVIESAMEAAQ